MSYSKEADFQKQTSKCTFSGKIAFVIDEVKSRKLYQFDILFEDPIIDFSKTLKCQWSRLGTSRQNGKPSQAKPGKKLGLLRKPSRPLCKIPNQQAQAKPSFGKSLP